MSNWNPLAPGELYPRSIEHSLREAIVDTPVVCLLGPRQSGKTTLVKHLFSERPYVSFDSQKEYQLASEDPDGYIQRLPDAVTIDEVQRVPEIINAIKFSVDVDRRPGRFLLTGSANLLQLPRISESLSGRVEFLELQPLTESEKARSSGRFIRDLLQGNLHPIFDSTHAATHRSEIDERVRSGGYTEPLRRDTHRARRWRANYIRTIVEREVADSFQVRNINLMSRLVELLAWRTGQLLNINELARSLQANRITVEQYLNYLEQVYLVRRLYAWHTLQTKRLIKAPKVHFVDSGLAAMLTDMPTEDDVETQNYMGHLMESFIVQQVIAQAGWTDANLKFWHYRDKDQVEVDVILTLGNRTWGIESKLTPIPRRQHFMGLNRLADRCGTNFQQGVLFYSGNEIVSFGDSKFVAVPISELWKR